MKSGPTHSSPLPSNISEQENLSQAIDRRRFLQYAAAVSAMAGFNKSTLGQPQNPAAAAAQADSSESRLPDGTEFPHWEQPLTFTKTYYVDNQSSQADDSGPGTKARPFRTINQAAQVLQPGERVVIASGVYRECVRPARGGTSPTQMISYEAAPGAEVIVKGSAVLKDGWQQESVSMGRYGANGPTDQPPTPITAWRSAAVFRLHHPRTAAERPSRAAAWRTDHAGSWRHPKRAVLG